MSILEERSRRRKKRRAAGSERPSVRWFGWCKWWIRSSPAWVRPKQKACPAHRHWFHESTGIWEMAGREVFLSFFFTIPLCHESRNVSRTNRIGLHVGSVSFPLTFAFPSLCYYNHWRLLSIAVSTPNGLPLGTCPSAWTLHLSAFVQLTGRHSASAHLEWLQKRRN